MGNVRIIKLGGSVVSTKDTLFDFDFVRKFKEVLDSTLELGNKYGVILGGGFLARYYRDTARELEMNTTTKDLHWIGTTVNVLHAEVTRAIFGEQAEGRPLMFEDYYTDEPYNLSKDYVFGGGGRPGHSGDVDAILLANRIGAKEVISLKNIEKLYTADPNKDPEAKPVDSATWEEYYDIIGGVTEHEPGGNYVVDPVASRMAEKSGIKFVILKGDNLENIRNYLSGKDFVGSIVG